jgi:transposase-like protein/IS1 family transposase
VTCHSCRTQMVKAGFYGAKKVQRWKCQQCNKRFSEPQAKPFGQDVRLPADKVAMILKCLVEGNSVRSTARLCDVEKRTVLNLLKTAGDHCERFMERTLRDVPVKELALDECWSYVFKKEGHKHLYEKDNDTIGDQYVYIALERNTKLVVAWHLGKRDRDNTYEFISKVRKATANERFEIATDAWPSYIPEIANGTAGDRGWIRTPICVARRPERSLELRRRPSDRANGSVATRCLGSASSDDDTWNIR